MVSTIAEIMIGLNAEIGLTSRTLMILLGLGSFAMGILLMFYHRRYWDAVGRVERKERNLRFENKKYWRRVVVAALISSLGAVMSSTYFVIDPKVFAMMVVIMFTLLVSILLLASLDLMTVGLHQMSTLDEKAKKEMVQKAFELREKRKRESENRPE